MDTRTSQTRQTKSGDKREIIRQNELIGNEAATGRL